MPSYHKVVKTCSFEGCTRPHSSKGWCQTHYRMIQKTGGVRKISERYKNTEAFCSFEGCVRPPHARGLCGAHNAQMRRHGVLKPLSTSGHPPAPKGSTTIRDGYILEKDLYHPNARGHGWVLQHIKVMSDHLGRRIRTEDGENVHHINGVKTDNRIENLELWSTKQPKGQRVEDKVSWAREIIELYGDIFPEESRQQ